MYVLTYRYTLSNKGFGYLFMLIRYTMQYKIAYDLSTEGSNLCRYLRFPNLVVVGLDEL